ncbi:MAG: hypothetical protein RLZZ568_1440 [Cyanobacteriota bacterium]|jgi:hypothetical protein
MNIITSILALVLVGLMIPAVKAEDSKRLVFASDKEAGKIEGEIQQGDLTATLRYQTENIDGLESWTPIVTVTVKNQVVVTVQGTENLFFPAGLIQITEMDRDNAYPEVVFSTYTGGAHCCNEVMILTSNPEGNQWFPVELGLFDGVPHPAVDIDHDGIDEYVERDNRFLYRFTSYAASFAPTQIWQLQGMNVVDVTHQPRFLFVHQQNLDEMSQRFSEDWLQDDPNGFLAAYVANKALVGQLPEGWQTMMKYYDDTPAWGLSECKQYDDQYNCLQEVTYDSYPEALRQFLIETDYIDK